MNEDQIRKECWDKALHALGTSYVFSQKLNFYKKGIRIITVLVLVVPILLGGTVMAYGSGSVILKVLIAITAPVVIIHLVLAIISLIYKWDDALAYCLESQTDNRIISDAYKSLAMFPPKDIVEMEKQFVVVKTKDDSRTIQDAKVNFTNKDNRKGMRYALWIFKRECPTCHEIPPSMVRTKCLTCGKF